MYCYSRTYFYYIALVREETVLMYKHFQVFNASGSTSKDKMVVTKSGEKYI